MAKKRVGIIGAGIVGTALAYYLSEYDNVKVTVFEKSSVGSGTTAKSAGTVCLFDDSVSHEFWPVRLLGFQTYTAMEEQEKGSTGFQQTGTLVVATDNAVEDSIKTGIAHAMEAGYQAEYFSDHAAIRRLLEFSEGMMEDLSERTKQNYELYEYFCREVLRPLMLQDIFSEQWSSSDQPAS